jgi:hypothetical protein
MQRQPASNNMQAVRVPILKSQHFLCNLAHAVGCHRLRIKLNRFSAFKAAGGVQAHLQRRSFGYRADPSVCSLPVYSAANILSIRYVKDFQLLQGHYAGYLLPELKNLVQCVRLLRRNASSKKRVPWND